MLKKIVFILVVFLFSKDMICQSQEIIWGEISFVSSRNVYVKFNSTENISIGDTLSIETQKESFKGLLVNSKSSTSVVTTPLFQPDIPFAKGQKVFFEKIKIKEIEIQLDTILELSKNISEEDQDLILPTKTQKENIRNIRGSFAAGTYSNFNNYRESHRFRYALILNGSNFANNRLSFENYITFRYSSQNWNDIKEDFFSGLRIFNLAVQYSVTPTSSLSLGRRINRKFSNMGAVDGIQFEKEWKNFFIGSIVGTRPDHITYGLNLNLLEIGVFGGFKNDKVLSTIALVEQKNKMATDRRFFFMQHSGNIANKVFVFSSFEIDIFKKINEKITNKPEITNFFISANTNLTKRIRFTTSYDSRRNIIFYESYKSYIDQLIDEETRQGLRAALNLRILKNLNMMGNVNWRFQKSGLNDSKNANIIINWGSPWGKGSSISLSNSFLKNNYMESMVLGLRLRQSISKGKLDGDAYIRRINYNYLNRESITNQSYIGLNLNYFITKQIGLYLYGEIVFSDDSKNIEKRVNTRIIKRF